MLGECTDAFSSRDVHARTGSPDEGATRCRLGEVSPLREQIGAVVRKLARRWEDDEHAEEVVLTAAKRDLRAAASTGTSLTFVTPGLGASSGTVSTHLATT